MLCLDCLLVQMIFLLCLSSLQSTFWSAKTMKEVLFALFIPVLPHCTISTYTQIVQIFVYFLSNNVLHMFTATKLSSTNTPAQTHSMQKVPPPPPAAGPEARDLRCYNMSVHVIIFLDPFQITVCFDWSARKNLKKKGRMIHRRIINRLGLEFTWGRASLACDCDVTRERERETWPTGVCSNKKTAIW